MHVKPLHGLLAALLAVPPLLLVASLYGVHGMVLWDARTLPCGLAAWLAGDDPNAYLNRPDYAGACAGYGYEYMLPPLVTRGLAGVFQVVGGPLATVLYALAYAGAVAMLLRPEPGRARWPALAVVALTACGAYLFELGSGNLTVLFLGGLIALLLPADGRVRTGPATVWCALAALAKPQFALYLLVPLFAGGQTLAAAAGLAGATLSYAGDAFFDAAAFDRWSALVVGVVYGETHFGVLRLLDAVAPAVARRWWVDFAAWGAWAALLLSVLWRLRERLPTPRDKAMAALLAVTLLQPRLKEYDTLVLIPLLFWLDARLPTPDRALLRRTLAVVALIAPALWWWGRKLRLVLGVDHPTLTQWADPAWMIANQGYFLSAAALVLLGFLVRLPSAAANGGHA